MKLPALRQPQTYVGMYVFDFGEWTSVGYTAEEIDVLLNSDEHRSGCAYRIHRVDERSCLELRGVSSGDLTGQEAIVFASREADSADRDYETLHKLAIERPGPWDVELLRADIPDLDPPHVACLIYPHHAGDLMSSWLSAVGFNGGDVVMCGQEILTLYRRSSVTPIRQCRLDGLDRFSPRPKEEVLRTVHEPVQR